MKYRRWLVSLVLLLGAMVLLPAAVDNLEQGRSAEDIRQLELVLQRTAVECYAIEGIYPPDVAYMIAHYGLVYDESCYIIHYERTASNFMPEITVMERLP